MPVLARHSASWTSISLSRSSSVSLVSPQVAMPSKSIHLRQRSRATRAVDSTLRTHNRLLLQMEGNRNAVHRNAQVKRQNEGARLTKIESLSPAIHDCLPFLRKACGEVPDDLNSERESRQSRSTHGPLRNQLPALDLRTPAV